MATKHTHKVVFGKRVDGCPRCVELTNGAEPVRWRNGSNGSNGPTIQQLRAHNCQRSGCGPVCTYGDY